MSSMDIARSAQVQKRTWEHIDIVRAVISVGARFTSPVDDYNNARGYAGL